jgi:hypothetical protein
MITTSTANEFSLFIETLANEKRITKMDAILEYCNENFIDPVDVVPHINKSLKDKIELELQNEGKLPKGTTVSII